MLFCKQSHNNCNSLFISIWAKCCSEVCSTICTLLFLLFSGRIYIMKFFNRKKKLRESNQYLCSTRVSNELGAGKPRVARTAVCCLMFITAAELILVSGTLFVSRHVFGYSFSSDKEVVDAVSSMAPLVCLSVIIDGLQGVFSGFSINFLKL